MNRDKITRRDLFKTAAIATVGAGLIATASPKQILAAIQLAQSKPMVPTTELGTTGKQIPILLLGCSQKFDPVYDKLLHRCYKMGINYLDTAQAYANGQSHSTIGPFVEQINNRESLWITSKVMLFGKRATPEAYLANFEKMMPELKTDYLDMFFMHNVNSLGQLSDGHLKMAADLKKRGVIRHFGFSCHLGNVVALMNKAATIGPSGGIDAIMFRYNFTQYGNLELNKAIDACKNAGIGLIAMKTQASVPDDQDYVKNFVSRDFTLPQAKLKAVWADDRIDAANSEMTNVQQLEENAAAAISDLKLGMDEFQQLNQYAAQSAHNRCQGCNEICESRVEGDLRIADTLRYLMYAECYGNTTLARQRYRELSDNERFIDAMQLEAATDACPQGINIAERLSVARARLA